MKIFFYKSLLIFFLSFILVQFTIGVVVKDFKEQIYELKSKKNIEAFKNKMREEIKSGLESEKSKYKNPNKIDSYVDLMKKDLDKEFKIERFEDRRRLIEKYIDWVSVVYKYGRGDSKIYKVNMKLLFGESGEFIEVDSGKIKKDNQINGYPVYKVKSEVVGAKGFEPLTPWV